MNPRVKICGITGPSDAVAAAECGADAIGLIFAESPRKVSLSQAAEIVRSLPPFVCAVGVFVDAPVDEVIEIAGAAGLHAVQLSGSESEEYVRAIRGVEVIKCLHVADRGDLEDARRYESAHIHLDTAVPGAAGGTGRTFPWHLAVDVAASRAVILAGGLTPDNVAEAVGVVKPWAVDVSSGVEKRPGVKDVEKIRRFIANARSVDYA
ncbi:MAG: phosphoribosylanthranilate isomerase [Planctomycetota bacterium]|jgi:phosphoribosylanthranilate isomerase